MPSSSEDSSESFRLKSKVRKRSAMKKKVIVKPQTVPKTKVDSKEICVTRKDPLTGEESFYCTPCDEFFETG
jgi:hypothetical protein